MKDIAKRRILLTVLVVVTLAALLWVVKTLDDAPRTDDAYAYADTINVAPQVNGLIIEMPITENQLVKGSSISYRSAPLSRFIESRDGQLDAVRATNYFGSA